jgi:hypothetical protein
MDSSEGAQKGEIFNLQERMEAFRVRFALAKEKYRKIASSTPGFRKGGCSAEHFFINFHQDWSGTKDLSEGHPNSPKISERLNNLFLDIEIFEEYLTLLEQRPDIAREETTRAKTWYYPKLGAHISALKRNVNYDREPKPKN